MAAVACCEVMLKSCKGVSIILHREFHSTPAFRKLKPMYKTMSTSRAGKMKQGKHNPALHARAAVGYTTKADDHIG